MIAPMTVKTPKICQILAFFGFIAFGSPVISQQYVSIGTGSVAGVYYPAGGAICRLMNLARSTTGFRCVVDSTEGSIANINEIRAGNLEFGVVQSDWQFHAYNGSSIFSGPGAFTDLRAVFSIHPEPFTLVVREHQKINIFEDLRGKRVNIGNSGSGQRATLEVVLNAFDMTISDFSSWTDLTPDKMVEAICNDEIDALVYTVGHPATALTEATSLCDLRIVSVLGKPIDDLIAQNPFYRKVTIPSGTYKGNDDDAITFGVGATLVTTKDVPEVIVYTLVREVFDNIDDFRRMHPTFRNLNEIEMISDGLTAPLHTGALKYYRERGWK